MISKFLLYPKRVTQVCTFWIVPTLLLLLAVVPCKGAGVTWINPENGNWNTAANWSTGTVPTADDDVYINVDGTYTVTINSTVYAATITVGSGEGLQTLLIEGVAIDSDMTNYGVIKVRRLCTFNGVFENAGTGHLLVEGIKYKPATLIDPVGFVNHGLIELTNNNYSFAATLNITNGSTLLNYGTIRPLYGSQGGSRYINGSLDNHGTLDVTHHNLQIKNNSSMTNNGIIVVGEGKSLVFSNSTFHPGTGTISGLVTIASNGRLGSGTLSGIGTVLMSGRTLTGELEYGYFDYRLLSQPD